MKDAEIIKALECCTDRKVGFICNGCPLKNVPFCGGEIMRGSLDLINRLKEEIERLQKRNSNLKHALFEQQSYTAELQKELATAKSEAYKEFAKFLIDKSENGVIYISDLPDYVKEMG